jgi:transposase
LLEGIEAAEAEDLPNEEPPSKPRKKHRGKKTRFPEQMLEKVIEIELPAQECICADTGKAREFIRWEETVKYVFIPGHFERIRIRRAVYAVPSDAGDEGELSSQPVVTAPMPAQFRVIPGCMAACGLLVFLMVSKYCDHLPFYRIQQIFKRQYKVELDRTTMCHWMKRCAELLRILYEALRLELLSGNYLQIDETKIRLLDPETKGKAKNSYFWVIKKPGGGVLFHFDPGRGHEVAMDLLKGFIGKLQSDGYNAYTALIKRVRGLVLFHCWAHVRRKFVESLEANGAQAAWYVSEIQKLYRIESKAREGELDQSQREAMRKQESLPVLKTIKARLERDMSSVDILPSSPLGRAIRYTLTRWQGLLRYAEAGSGEVEIDNNPVENAIRPTAIGKKNWLFIGHPKAGQTSAIIYTMVENCRMWDIDPMEYLNDVLPRIMDHPKSRIAELLPRQWKQAREVAAAEEVREAAAAGCAPGGDAGSPILPSIIESLRLLVVWPVELCSGARLGSGCLRICVALNRRPTGVAADPGLTSPGLDKTLTLNY